MGKLDASPFITNTSKRLPIVFCLDVSPSMGWPISQDSKTTAMDLLNMAVNNFITELNADSKARTAAEVALVTFSSGIVTDTEFVSVSALKKTKIDALETGGTQMAQAVLRSIEKIEKRREYLEDMEIPYYAPFLILVTDGNPDENDDPIQQTLAIEAVRKHCDSHVGASEIIVPFVIGVGENISPTTLKNYAAGFTKGYFPIKGTTESARLKFNKVFMLIGNSTKKSIHLNGKAKAAEILKTVQQDMDDVLRDLIGE